MNRINAGNAISEIPINVIPASIATIGLSPVTQSEAINLIAAAYTIAAAGL